MKDFPTLAYVCPIPWDELRGDERERFCEKCGHRVSNFSEMSAAARAALLACAGTERICGSFYLRLSGEIVTPETPLTPKERSRIRQLGVATLSAGALALAAGCVTTAEQAKLSAPIPAADPQFPKQPPEPRPAAEAAKPPDKSKSETEDVIVLQALGVVCFNPPIPPGSQLGPRR